ncbi:MAG: hypothetical protein DRP82_02065 [Planctomycetota bacterium]|nr:MAG: hypothetical protein DRP82_02065 [Planctomycetota bacterium]
MRFALVFLALVAGCATGRQTATEVRNLDFEFATLKARVRSMLQKEFDIVEEPQEGVFVTEYQITPEGVGTLYQYSRRAVVEIKPQGALYNLYIRVDRYVRDRGERFERGWQWLARDEETEEKLRRLFLAEIRDDIRRQRAYQRYIEWLRGW